MRRIFNKFNIRVPYETFCGKLIFKIKIIIEIFVYIYKHSYENIFQVSSQNEKYF